MPEVTIENRGSANVPDSGQRRSDQKLTVRSYRSKQDQNGQVRRKANAGKTGC